MTSNRRAARSAAPLAEVDGVPLNLAAGPCVELWADPDAPCPILSARRHWRAARNGWALANGLTLPGDYRHLPRVLRDRGPYFRDRGETP